MFAKNSKRADFGLSDSLFYYDIVSYTFGDQNIAYIRGQFTFHKNDPEKVNQLWRGCEYLSSKRNEKEHRGFEI